MQKTLNTLAVLDNELEFRVPTVKPPVEIPVVELSLTAEASGRGEASPAGTGNEQRRGETAPNIGDSNP